MRKIFFISGAVLALLAVVLLTACETREDIAGEAFSVNEYLKSQGILCNKDNVGKKICDPSGRTRFMWECTEKVRRTSSGSIYSSGIGQLGQSTPIAEPYYFWKRIRERCEVRGGKLIAEEIKCIFNGSVTEQQCYASSGKGNCSGVESCTAYNVSGKSGEIVLWKSSCGGYANTTIDGRNEYIAFDCGCQDSDGADYYTKGTVTSYDAQAGKYVTATDNCEYDTINEFVCEGNEGKETEYKCPNGCEDGACMKEEVIPVLPPVPVKNEYYVSTKGNNNNPGTRDAPFRDINYAIYSTETPAVVYVSPGDYYNVKDVAEDLYVGVRENVDLVCLEKRNCIIRGGIYVTRNSIIDGFLLLGKLGGDMTTSTNEIFCGLNRFGAPRTGSVVYPGKDDLYPTDCENVVIRNNQIKNNEIRAMCFTVEADLTAINHQTKQPYFLAAGTPTYCKSITIEENNVGIDIDFNHFWGVEMLNVVGGTVKNNYIQSGKAYEKNIGHIGKKPHNPGSVLLENSREVAVQNNQLDVQCGPEGSKIGYGIIIFDRDGYKASSGITSDPNELVGNCYISLLRDFNKQPPAVCGDRVCDAEELFDEALGTEYSCYSDCCGNGICTWPENVPPSGKGGSFYCAADCG
ncbi:MAG TPA: DUF1565 domain-containing protein [Candidatus Nanoarchaeia archaeon]|nr:DUF1565 domain-containing protein [Candidatus Nanoarchaeia archaeon]